MPSQLNRGGDSSEFNDDMREHTLNDQVYGHVKRDEIAEGAHQSRGGGEFRGTAHIEGNSYCDQDDSYEVRCETAPASANAARGIEPYVQQDASVLHSRISHYNGNTPSRDAQAASQFERLHPMRHENLDGAPGQPPHTQHRVRPTNEPSDGLHSLPLKATPMPHQLSHHAGHKRSEMKMQDGPYSINNMVVLKQGQSTSSGADMNSHMSIIDKITTILNRNGMQY